MKLSEGSPGFVHNDPGGERGLRQMGIFPKYSFEIMSVKRNFFFWMDFFNSVVHINNIASSIFLLEINKVAFFLKTQKPRALKPEKEERGQNKRGGIKREKTNRKSAKVKCVIF